MSRFVWALCACLLVATPLVAIASHSTDAEPPDAFRHAVNTVIGDASYDYRFGTLPPPGVDPDLRVRTHLEFMHALLSSRDVSTLPAELRESRRENLARLKHYVDAGVFPRNHLFADETRPCFIDRDNRICAVGYLVEQSAGRELAERINAEFQSAFLRDMHLPELDQWIAASGLSLLELSMIQPGYDPKFLVSVTRANELSVKVKGAVYDDGMGCNIKYAYLDFGDGVWVSPKNKSGILFFDVEHTYGREGSYVIVGTAVADDDCGNLTGTDRWVVNVGRGAFQIKAIKLPGGPPIRVYLQTTDEVRLECLSAATVQWEKYQPPEPAGWHFEGGVYKTAIHEYSWYPYSNVTVTNTYMNNCAANQAATILVDSATMETTATEVSSWGRIKAMYR